MSKSKILIDKVAKLIEQDVLTIWSPVLATPFPLHINTICQQKKILVCY